MLIVELIYKKPLDVVNQFLEEHRHFLDTLYNEGLLLASGPKKPRNGGVMIAITDKNTMYDRLKADPFYKKDIADYRVIEFSPNKLQLNGVTIE